VALLVCHLHSIDNATSYVGDGGAHENMQPFLVLPMIISTTWTDVLPAGALVAFAGNSVPSGFELCDGLLSVFTGLDPAFANHRPDMRLRVALGSGSGPGLTPRATGDQNGTLTANLTMAELPPHSHSVQMGGQKSTATPGNNYVSVSVLTDVCGSIVDMDQNSLLPNGVDASLAHNNLGLSTTTDWLLATADVASPVGSMVHYARDLIASTNPGEMRAVGQSLTSARQDLLSLGLTAAPDTQDAFLMGRAGVQEALNVRRGSDTVSLLDVEIPSHDHVIVAADCTAVINTLSPASKFGPLNNAYGAAFSLTAMAAGSIVSSPSAPHENMHPYVAMDVILFVNDTCNPTMPGSVCNCDLLTGVCAAGTTGSVPIVISGNTSYAGDVVMVPTSNLVVNIAAGASLTVGGTAKLNGTLTLLAAGAGTTTVLTAGNILGHFGGVTVVPQFAMQRGDGDRGVHGHDNYSDSVGAAVRRWRGKRSVDGGNHRDCGWNRRGCNCGGDCGCADSSALLQRRCERCEIKDREQQSKLGRNDNNNLKTVEEANNVVDAVRSHFVFRLTHAQRFLQKSIRRNLCSLCRVQ
jgi:microcystin-dependent protein